MSITVAAWNVNSIRSRLPHLISWLAADKPDVVLLQELKCTDDVFPYMEIEELGYNIAVHGEKTYNGVAILSKFPLNDVSCGLAGDDSDTQSRYIEGVINVPSSSSPLVGEDQGGGYGNKSTPHPNLPPQGGKGHYNTMRVASVYVPNGMDVSSQKFAYKLRFLERLYTHIEKLLTYDEMLVIGGDYNIAPDDSDVHNPKEWEGSVLTHDEVRSRLRRILNLGVYDACRLLQPTGKTPYSWWDYRGNSLAEDNGLRIDHLLLSPQAADKLNHYSVKKELRELEKASDHAPVIGNFFSA